MKPVTLHPLSVLAGLVLACLVVLSIGAAQTPRPTTKTTFVGEVPAEWWMYATTPYTVPSDRRLVVTLMSVATEVYVNGVFDTPRFLPVRTVGLPDIGTRVVPQPGDVITGGQLWGYLEPLN